MIQSEDDMQWEIYVCRPSTIKIGRINMLLALVLLYGASLQK